MLPTVTGAYISTRPPASRTMMAPLPFVSSIDVPCGAPSALLPRWPCCVGSRSGSTAGTMMVAFRSHLDVRIEPGQERGTHVKALGQLFECRHVPQGRQCLLLHHVLRDVVQERARHIGVRDGVLHERLLVRRTERFDSFWIERGASAANSSRLAKRGQRAGGESARCRRRSRRREARAIQRHLERQRAASGR